LNFPIKKSYIVFLLVIVICIALFVFVKRYNEDYTSDFIDVSVYSSVLDEKRKIFIRLPNGYDPKNTYPLIIKSDGNFNLNRWNETLSDLSTKQMIQDSIVVAVPNLFWIDSRNRDLVPPYARQDVKIEARPVEDNQPEIFGKADLFLQFIEKELLPYIEKNYSINDNRVLSGFSAGGSFVLYTVVTKPQLFTGYFAFSPAAWYDNSVVVKEFNKHISNTKGKPTFLYLSLGEAENPIITGAFNGLLDTLKSKAPDNLKWGFSFSEGARHVENPYISIPKAITEYYVFREKEI
jgi:predicted alpha/beta superfamily hydrolase